MKETPLPTKEPALKHCVLIILVCFFPPLSPRALPVDWHGAFGLDTTLIDNYRRMAPGEGGVAENHGSQEIPLVQGGEGNASFQTYLFRLNPTIIINDAASLFGEISSGYGRGGRLGDDSQRSHGEEGLGGVLYPHNTSSGEEGLAVTQLYAKYYADTATYLLGRHGHHWGLGAVYNSGEKVWDRHATVRDGVTVQVKLGNFHISPYWAKIANTTLVKATKIREYGVGLLYDSYEKDLALGLHYGKKESSSAENSVKSWANAEDHTFSYPLGATEVKVTDIYLKKAFGDVFFAVEIPLFSGTLGNFYGRGNSDKYKARAILLEGGYKLSDTWSLLAQAGDVSGDSGAESAFEAMYLHPNFQVANLLFRYNLRAVADPNRVNVFDAHITNASFAKVALEYTGQKWTFHVASIWGRAREVATQGQMAFNHAKGRRYEARDTQEDSLGMEIDLNLDYRWNKEISVGLAVGHLFTGDYYAFTNDPVNRGGSKKLLCGTT